jgi:hypothetical protein
MKCKMLAAARKTEERFCEISQNYFSAQAEVTPNRKAAQP